LYAAREMARGGDPDSAVVAMRKAVNEMFREEQLGYGVGATAVLVETLLERGKDNDLVEAKTAIDRLADVPIEDGFVVRDIMLLRLRALLARARGDAAAYGHFRERHRDMARTLGFEGHIAWAEAMP
jgi:hypothetical protein